MVITYSLKPPTTTLGGALSETAKLLYELVTGKVDADLKRACDAHLREIKRVQARMLE
jgi:hypothetical protein